MPRIDGDAKRAARREQRGDDPVVWTFDGEDYTLPDELPLGCLEGIGRIQVGDYGALYDTLRIILGLEVFEKVEPRMSADDLGDLLEDLFQVYGISAPSSQASSATSSNGSAPSRLTSYESTEPTSPTPSGDPATPSSAAPAGS